MKLKYRGEKEKKEEMEDERERKDDRKEWKGDTEIESKIIKFCKFQSLFCFFR
jgi:hypothetical protein